LTYVKELEKHSEIKQINEHFQRNEGYEKSINEDKKY